MLEGGTVWEGAELTGTLEGLGAACWPGALSWRAVMRAKCFTRVLMQGCVLGVGAAANSVYLPVLTNKSLASPNCTLTVAGCNRPVC